jgi:hypothetical protein
MEVEDYEEHFKLVVVWRYKTNNKIVDENPHTVLVLRDSLHDWNVWQPLK